MRHVRSRAQLDSSAKWLLLTLLVSLILFGLNYYHQNQQGGIFYGRYLVLSESIQRLEYSYPGEDSAATYPIWGYPILMAVLDPLLGIHGVYVLNVVLLLVSFWLVYRLFELPSWDSPLRMVLFHGALIAYGMLLSVKWPAAIVGFLLLVFGILHERGRYGLASLCLLLAGHFRTEALLLWGIYLAFLAVQTARGRIRWNARWTSRRMYGSVAVVVCSLVLLSSWPLYQYAHHGRLLIGTSNSGGVLYVSLGQLPNNPWDRVFGDKAAGDYAHSQGVEDAWVLEGNEVLTRRFLQDVAEHPLAFAAKVAYNEARALTGGFYVTELRTLVIRHDPEKDRKQRDLLAGYRSDVPGLIEDLLSFRVHTYAMLSQFGLMALSALLLLGLLGTMLVRAIRGERLLSNPYAWMIAGQFLTIGLYFYHSRNVSLVVILFLFALFSMRPADASEESERPAMPDAHSAPSS